jgi:hypothetical protein
MLRIKSTGIYRLENNGLKKTSDHQNRAANELLKSNRLDWQMMLLGALIIALVSASIAIPIIAAKRNDNNPQIIINKVISNLEKISTVEIRSDVINIHTVDDTEPRITSHEWKGVRTVDFSNNKMKMTMSILGETDFSLQTYFVDGNRYFVSESPAVHQADSSWRISTISDDMWEQGSQIPFYIDLLKTAAQIRFLKNESINGKECYVILIEPSIQSIIDWVIGQQQPVGPQLDIMYGGGRPIVNMGTYQAGSVTIWINKSSLLPLKAEIEASFQGYVFDSPTQLPNSNLVTSCFTGNIEFSLYNHRTVIEIPQ